MKISRKTVLSIAYTLLFLPPNPQVVVSAVISEPDRFAGLSI